ATTASFPHTSSSRGSCTSASPASSASTRRSPTTWRWAAAASSAPVRWCSGTSATARRWWASRSARAPSPIRVAEGSGVILLEPYDEGDRAAWDAFVRASKNGNFLFLRDYMEYHRDRFEEASLVARPQRGGAPLALLPANRRGATLESHAGLTFGGWVCGGELTAATMLELVAVLERRAPP